MSEATMPPAPAALPEASTLEQEALETCLLAYKAQEWAKLAELVDAWELATGHVPALAALWRGRSAFWAQDYPAAFAWTARAYAVRRRLDPVDQVMAVSQMGEAYARLGRYADARRCWTDALRIGEPLDDIASRVGLGHLRLSLTDRWARGWKDQERRVEMDPKYGIPDGCTAWDGVSPGRIGVLHEQGIGDGVLFARFLPWVAQTSGQRPVYFGPDVLAPWMAGLDVVDLGAVGQWTPEHGIDYVVRMGSLPHLSKLDRPFKVKRFPPLAPASLVAARSQRDRTTLRVGVCWKGEATGHHAFERNLTAEQFAPVWAEVPGSDVTFVNLCHGADVPEGAPFARVDFADALDSGAAVASCDLVVSVDTAIVHLAGSLGVPTVCLTPTIPDWRYGGWPWGVDSVWYESVTVARREHAAAVEGVVRQARFAVETMAALHAEGNNTTQDTTQRRRAA
ncbi:MAG: hypothetical protein ACYC3F_17105 [Gemmatimonadaceae bacterium]